MANEEAAKGEAKGGEGRTGEPRAQSLAEVRALARLLRQYDLTEIEVETAEGRVVLKRSLAPALAAAPAAPAASDEPVAAAVARVEDHALGAADSAHKSITSPFVGTFYRAASPDGPPLVEVGQTVRKGQTLCIIEAMKLMNDMPAEVAGKIVKVCVDNGTTVEYGQTLFLVDPKG